MTTTDEPGAAASESAAHRPPARLLHRENLPVVAGVVALVTLAAFENRAVMTILPTVVRDLDGWSLYGASTGTALVTFTVAMAWSGGWTDRRGPRPVLVLGIAAFVLAQVVSALAPTMAVFVAGRAASGAAEALIDTALMVLVAQALPPDLRAKVFASFAAAWILPSLLGPGIAGAVDAVAGWRAVFVVPLLIVPVSLVLVRSALARTHPGAGADDVSAARGSRRRVTAALVLAGGLTVTTLASPLLSTPGTRRVGLLAIALGLLAVVAGASRALPAGTTRLVVGVPAVVAVRLLVAAAFTGVGGLIPLMLVQTRGASTALAGVSLSITGVLWALGSWLNSTHLAQSRVPAFQRLRIGSGLIAAGSLGPVLLSLDRVGMVPGMLGWALAALGMGILSPTLATELLSLSPPSEQGRASAAQGLAISTGVALQTGVVGGVVAWQGAEMGGAAFAAVMATGGATAVLAAIASGRARTT